MNSMTTQDMEIMIITTMLIIHTKLRNNITTTTIMTLTKNKMKMD